jgi:hypothetical protein
MTLVGSVVVGIALLVGVLVGARRGATKEVMALVGVLLGALLVTTWASRWGVAIATRTGWQRTTGEWIGAMMLLWGTALFAGYGSAALLPRTAARMSSAQRIAGAALGLVSATLLTGLTLRLTQTLFYGEVGNDRQMTWIRQAVVSRFLLERFDLLVLGATWTFAVVALVVSLVRLLRMFFVAAKPAPAPAAKPTPATPSASVTPAQPTQPTPAIPPGMERSFLDKPGGTPGSQGRP